MGGRSSSSPRSNTPHGWSSPQASEPTGSTGGSHNDLAAKALKKLAGPHVPASLKALERAVAAANRQAEEAQRAKHNTGEPAAGAEPPVDYAQPGELADEDLDDVETEDAETLGEAVADA